MSRSRLKRKVATLRAVMWLNTFRDSLSSGVLRIDPRLSDGRTAEIERELASFRDTQLPRINHDLGISADVYATVHLKRWEEESATETGEETDEVYPFTKLLREQRFREAVESLRHALHIVQSNHSDDADSGIILRIALRKADGLLLSAENPTEPTPAPGAVGEHLQDCDEAIEAVLNQLDYLRRNGLESDDAADLSEICAILHERAFQLAKHIRDKGLV